MRQNDEGGQNRRLQYRRLGLERALAFWNGLGLQRQMILLVASIGVFAAVLGLARLATNPSMSLLYSGLDPVAASDVVTALDAQGALYEVRGNAIYVDAAQRDVLRMSLAGEGLPANTAQGYELLDSLSGFGTTSQMFDAAYWRAKEGELARTIVAARHISAARVHIGNPGARPFDRSSAATASVSVTTTSGALSSNHAKALRYLVASAVPGLLPEDVSVIDSAGGLIASGDEMPSGIDTAPTDRAETLRASAERLLEARVGYGNAVVQLSLETINESEMITERLVDPDSRIAISTDTEERTNTANDSRGGAVTVASNLPDGDDAGSNGSSSTNSTETRERINYEISETQREVLREPGDIRRMSVAVLVDGIRTVDANGAEVWQARGAEELADLQELVSAAVGLDAARGDTITVKSLEFEPVVEQGTQIASGFSQSFPLDIMSLIQLGVLALVALVLGFGVVRPILKSGPRGSGAVAALPPASQPETPDFPPLPPLDDSPTPALDGEIDFPGEMNFAPEFAPDQSDGGLPALGQDASSDAVARLRDMINARQDETVEILRNWMEDGEAAR